MFVCGNHPAVPPMNHLEFLKHSQEISSTQMYGSAPPPKCPPVSVSQGQVISMPLKEWQNIKAVTAQTVETHLKLNLKLRWGFSFSSIGALLMIFNGARFVPIGDLQLSILGWTQMLAGFTILAGSAMFYSNRTKYVLASGVILIAAIICWIAVLLTALLVISGTAFVSGRLIILLPLAPLFSTIGAIRNLLQRSIIS